MRLISTRYALILTTLILAALASSTAALAGDVTLAWDPAVGPGLGGYKLYYGTASRQYTNSIDVGNVTTYPVKGLPAATYYFAVTAYNSTRTETGYSNETSAVVAAADTQAPVISLVASSSITASSVTISWTTNEGATTQVEYGVSTAYGSLTSLDTVMRTAHSVGIGGLAPATIYHYRVGSRDAAGNSAVSADFTFTTAVPADTTPPVISAVASASVTSSSATITWTTNEAADGLVEYGTTTGYGSVTSINTARVTSHSQSLGSLTAKTTYHFRVKSKDAAGNQAVSADFTFTTAAAADTTPPVISAVTASVVTSTSATVSWTTNEPADGQVEYGTSTTYGSSTTLNSALTTSHAQALNGLVAGRLYHYRVKSKDAAGNPATSTDYTFVMTTADVTAGLVAAYGFDEGAGTTTADYSPSGSVATLNGASWTNTAKFGKALSFNGKNSYVSAGLAGLPDVGAPKTVACWLYLNSKASGLQSTVVLANSARQASVKHGTRSSQIGVLQFGDTWIVASNLPPTRRWHHFAYVFDGSVNRFYVDGALASTSTVIPPAAPVTAFQIGRSVPASEYYKGLIDEVRVYNRALAQDEVKLIMSAPVAGLKPGGGALAAINATADPDSAAAMEVAAEYPAADPAAPEQANSLPIVGIQMTQQSYGIGQTVGVESYWVSNPSEYARDVELKTWLQGPDLNPVPVGDTGAGDVVTLAPRHDEDYGRRPLFDVAGDLPPGRYQFGARAIDPTTGDVLSEDVAPFTIGSAAKNRTVESRREVSLLAALEEWGEYGIMNVGGADASLEVKMWLEAAGQAPVPVLSLGTDGALVLAPGDSLSLDPLASFAQPSGTWALRARILDPTTGRILSESVTLGPERESQEPQ